MVKAVITLDDQPGGVGMSLFLEGGFSKDSPAHCAANMLIQHMEAQSETFSEGETKWTQGPEAQWIAGDVVAIPEGDDTKQRVAALADIVTTNAVDLQH